MLSVDIDDRGCGTVAIADAEGELQTYRIKFVPRGMSAWAVELTRVDTGNAYTVRFFKDGKGECECPAFKYRKRGEKGCKHTAACHSLRAFLSELISQGSDRCLNTDLSQDCRAIA